MLSGELDFPEQNNSGSLSRYKLSFKALISLIFLINELVKIVLSSLNLMVSRADF